MVSVVTVPSYQDMRHLEYEVYHSRAQKTCEKLMSKDQKISDVHAKFQLVIGSSVAKIDIN